jgi:hypothetical protein
VIVEELDPDRDPNATPPYTLDELRDQLRSAIADARDQPGVGDVTRGKFIGPLK